MAQRSFVKIDTQRLQLLEKLLIKRIDGAITTISWSESLNETLGSRLSDKLLEKLDRRSGDVVRGILSLRKKVSLLNKGSL